MKISKEKWRHAALITLKISEAFITGLAYVLRAVFIGLTPKKTKYEGTLHKPGDILSRWNKGFAYGSFKTTRHDSRQSALVIGGSGSGKSVTVMLPTLYNMTDDSLVIHDCSGELYQLAAGYLHQQGYEIKVLHYARPDISDGFNPLRWAEGSDIQKICFLKVRAKLGDGEKDPFWNTQSAMFLTLMCKIVKTQPPEYHHFTSVKWLLENYQINPASVDHLVAEIGKHNQEILNEYKVFLKYESKVMMNIISTCRSALDLYLDPSVQKVTSMNTIDFEEFRNNKVALFIQNKTSDMHYYGVLTSIFAQQFFNYIMNQPPNNKKQRNIYFLLDEASSLYLPNTLQIALSNLRKFSSGVMMLVQDYNQLVHLYGKHEAEAIKTNCYIKVYYPNQDIDTCRELETFLGKREYVDKENQRKIRPVLTADEIKTMPKGTALIFAGSNRAIYARMRPYYKNLRQWLYSRIPAPVIERKLPEGPVPLLPLPKVEKKNTSKKATQKSSGNEKSEE